MRARQETFPAQFPGVHPGPDLDALFDTRHRHDGGHFSDTGLDAAALAWWEAIAAAPP